MVTVSGVLGSELAPRRALRENYRDWISRNCLFSPIDLSLTGSGPLYWMEDDLALASNPDDPYKAGMHFKDISINLATPADLIEMFFGSGNTSFDNLRHFSVDIFCKNFTLSQGIVNGQIGTNIFQDKSFPLSNAYYERGYSRHANSVFQQSQTGTPTIGGGAWGCGASNSGNIYRNSHFAALTEAQAFLTDQGPINLGLLRDENGGANNDRTPPTRFPSHEFIDSIDMSKGGADRGGFSVLVPFGGFGYNASLSPDLTSGPGGHIRIFALESFTIGANGILRARGSQAAARGGGGGTIEIITNSFRLEGSVADQIDVRGGGVGLASGGGGGGIFVYANSFSYGTSNSFQARGRGAVDQGLLIDENNLIVRSVKTPHAGVTRLYSIDRLDTSVL